jgi:hypothetical protein
VMGLGAVRAQFFWWQVKFHPRSIVPFGDFFG